MHKPRTPIAVGVRGFHAFRRTSTHLTPKYEQQADSAEVAPFSVGDVTWEEAIKYAENVLDKECADAGVTVEVTDPRLVANTVRILRAGRRRHNAVRAEVAA